MGFVGGNECVTNQPQRTSAGRLTFMRYYMHSTLTPSPKQISVRKGSSFCDRGRLNFFCVTRHLADGLESCFYRFLEIFLSKGSLSQNKYYFNLYEFLKRRIHALVGRLKNRCFCWFLAVKFVPLKGTPTWRLRAL